MILSEVGLLFLGKQVKVKGCTFKREGKTKWQHLGWPVLVHAVKIRKINSYRA